MKVKDYKDLEIWKAGIEIVDAIYQATASFPDQESYSLTNQIRRASVSIPSKYSRRIQPAAS